MNLTTHSKTPNPVIELHPHVEKSVELIFERLPYQTASGYGIKVLSTKSGDFVFELTWPFIGDQNDEKRHGRVAIRRIFEHEKDATRLARNIANDLTPVQTIYKAASKEVRRNG